LKINYEKGIANFEYFQYQILEFKYEIIMIVNLVQNSHLQFFLLFSYLKNIIMKLMTTLLFNPLIN